MYFCTPKYKKTVYAEIFKKNEIVSKALFGRSQRSSFLPFMVPVEVIIRAYIRFMQYAILTTIYCKNI